MTIENHEGTPKSLELARILENTDDENVLRNNIGDLLKSLEADLKINLLNDPSIIYESMQNEKCLARVETLSRVLEAVELNIPLNISDDDEIHYANAVLPTIQGIKIAFSEGLSPGPVRAMVGFGKTIIGFRTENLKVEEINFDPDDVRGANERQYLCRHVSGVLKAEDIRTVILRIPRHLLLEDVLDEDEKTNNGAFVFRAFQLNKS